MCIRDRRKTAALILVEIQDPLAKFNKSGIQKTVSGRYLGVAHATLGKVLTMRSDLMGHIWGGRLEFCADPCNTPLGRILSSLLASPITRFTVAVEDADLTPFAIYAGEEIISGASLADVLDQEFGLDLEDDAIVLIEPCAQPTLTPTCPVQLGHHIGHIIVSLAQSERDGTAPDGLLSADNIAHSFHREMLRTVTPGQHIH